MAKYTIFVIGWCAAFAFSAFSDSLMSGNWGITCFQLVILFLVTLINS